MTTLFSTPLPAPSGNGSPTWEIAELFPYQGEWTESEYLALSTNRLIELYDGRLEVLPMPTLLHQAIVRFLLNLFQQFVQARKLGEVVAAPLPVRLGRGQFREPDVVYLAN